METCSHVAKLVSQLVLKTLSTTNYPLKKIINVITKARFHLLMEEVETGLNQELWKNCL